MNVPFAFSRKTNTMWYWLVSIRKKKREKRQPSRKDHFQGLSVWESFNRIAFNLINVLIPLNVSRLLGCHQSHNHHWKLGQQNTFCWNYLGDNQTIDRKIENENCFIMLNELKFCEKFFFKHILKISASILKNKKKFYFKNKIFSQP